MSRNDIPEEKRTYEVCLENVAEFGIGWVPVKYRTEEMCKKSFTKHFFYEFYEIPEEFITQKMCNHFIQQSSISATMVLDRIPELFQTAETYTELVKKNWSVISIVPRELVTHEMCEAAYEEGGAHTLEYFPPEFRKAFVGSTYEEKTLEDVYLELQNKH